MKAADFLSLYDFTGQTLVITGGTGFLGSEMVTSLAQLGANVAVIGRGSGLPDRITTRIQGFENRVALFTADITDQPSLSLALDQIHAHFGAVHALVNAGGGNLPSATTNPQNSFFDLPTAMLRQAIDLNLMGTILPCQVFGREMADRGAGSIVNLSSMAADRPLSRIPAYSAAKAGISNFTQWLAVCMARDYSPNIRVNAIAPGFFLGDQNRYLLVDPENGDLTPRGRSIIDLTPMGRFGDSEDLVGVLAWLLSPASAFVTGVVIPVDGGFSAFAGV
jgi:NAD(P)-dependent dehydrogenase (short-subunit alcohol dehydrogenase family)